MHILLIAFLGLLVGGVVNALADDLPARRGPRLPSYGDGQRRPPLAWLGITAFMFRRRRLPWRHPLVEVTLSALTTLTFVVARDNHALPFAAILLWLAVVALFVLIAVIDLEHRRILATPLLACVLLTLVRAFAFPQSPPTVASMLVGASCACLGFALVYLGGRLFVLSVAGFQRPPMSAFGRGDVYLMTVGGLIVGFPHALVAMVLTMLLGGVGALGYISAKSARGGYRRFSAIPYAPFILASIYLVMLLRDKVNSLIFGL